MDKLLIVSSSDQGRKFLTELCAAQSLGRPFVAENGAQARRMLIDDCYDLIVINAPLRDEFGQELALGLTQSTDAGIILLVKGEMADAVSAKVEDYGVLVLAKPLSKQLFFQSVKMVAASRRRLLGLQTENIKLQHKIEEIRMVDRAKCALIQYLGFTEPQAHRYIEKQAMDLRQTRREVAESILKTYES